MAPAQRRDDLEVLVNEFIIRWGLQRLCFALADLCYAHAKTEPDPLLTERWSELGHLFTEAEMLTAQDLTGRDNGK